MGILGQPMALVSAMWNHATMMREQFAKRKLSWPELTSQDLDGHAGLSAESALGAQRGRPY